MSSDAISIFLPSMTALAAMTTALHVSGETATAAANLAARSVFAAVSTRRALASRAATAVCAAALSARRAADAESTADCACATCNAVCAVETFATATASFSRYPRVRRKAVRTKAAVTTAPAMRYCFAAHFIPVNVTQNDTEVKGLPHEKAPAKEGLIG